MLPAPEQQENPGVEHGEADPLHRQRIKTNLVFRPNSEHRNVGAVVNAVSHRCSQKCEREYDEANPSEATLFFVHLAAFTIPTVKCPDAFCL